MKKLLKNKNFFLLFQGSLVSAIGTSLYGFAAGLYIQDLFGADGGALWLGRFMTVSILVRILVSPLAGVFIDKWKKVRVLVTTDFLRGLLFFGTLYILNMGLEKETLAIVLLVITGIASLNQAFFGPASMSVLPEIVGEDQLQAANGANSIIQSAQTIFGVVAGMFLYELVGFEVAVLANAISFMFSAFTEMFIRTPFKKPKAEVVYNPNDETAPKKPTFYDDFVFGFKYLLQKEGLLTMMMFSLLLNFAFTPFFGLGFPYLFKTELGKSAFPLGISEIVFAVSMLFFGVLVGSIKFKKLDKPLKTGLVGLSGSFVFTAALVYFVTYDYISYNWFYGLFLFANVLLAGFMMYTNVPLNTGMMKVIEPSVRGRVFGTIQALSTGAIPIGITLGSRLVDSTNVAMLGIACSVVVFFPTMGFLFNKKVGKLIDSIDEENNKEKGPSLEEEFVA